jgi:hypothetical protein
MRKPTPLRTDVIEIHLTGWPRNKSDGPAYLWIGCAGEKEPMFLAAIDNKRTLRRLKLWCERCLESYEKTGRKR